MSIRHFILIMIGGTLLAACGRLGAPAEDSSGGSGTPGVVDNASGFYVRHRASDKYTYITHKGRNTFDTKCTAAVNERATCYVEAEELDLAYHGVELTYNVPSDMCSYFRMEPYWYYRWRPGQGDPAATYETNAAGTVLQRPTCAYDYTSIKGPNCCIGTYTLTTINTDSSGNVMTTQKFNEPWGGDLASCISGPATLNMPKSKDGYPLPTIEYTEDKGLNKSYKAVRPDGAPLFRSNVFFANYWTTNDSATPFSGLDQVLGKTSQVLPGGSTFAAPVPGNAFYRFECLDRDEETISEILVQVREWNSRAAFNDRVNNPDGHDEGGAEANPFEVAPVNDRRDWADFTTNFPAFSE